jgi:hypothetical protein
MDKGYCKKIIFQTAVSTLIYMVVKRGSQELMECQAIMNVFLAFFFYIYKLWLKIDDVRETLVGENIGDIV